ncbi:FG-GAP repeat domain-containing protein [Sorangium sp. So ce1389]|uniref:FG-GAP repeat domain-containing protein n=1 Tax=Sorangium sp. So ce1389 TaxID=3133336 RepID=UPI003F613B75
MAVKFLASVAASFTTGACAGELEPLDANLTAGARAGGLEPLDTLAIAPPTSSGGAAPRSSGGGWKIVQAFDFNFDGMADVLWNDAERSLMAVWFMDGPLLLTQGPFIPGPPGGDWIARSSDFNFDGLGDVIWRHEGQNLMAVWLMHGGLLLAPGPILPGPSGQGWTARANDFDGDGISDVLWNHVERNLITVWSMEGSRLLAPGPFIPGPSGGRWAVGGVADFNADGMSDMVWNDAERNLMSVWLMNGPQPLAAGPVIPGPVGEGWTAIRASDFNADGNADVLWTNEEKGLMAVWLMRGTELLAPGPSIPGPAGEGWSARAAGDVNFDSMSDVIWQRDGASEMAVWLMEGSHLLARGPVIAGPHDGG